jgi:hypothetical protein
VLPTDLVAIVARGDRVSPNEAVTRDRIGSDGSQHPLGAALEQWFSFATGRHTWISVKGTALRGLASARRRGTKAAWEIDCLIFSDDDPGIVLSLLDRVTQDAGRAGAEKVFLRLPAGSAAVDEAIRSGFAAFQTERLLARTGAANGHDRRVTRDGLRRWGRADAYGTFQLYNRWTPEPVRRMEAATFGEWQAARERVSPPRATRQAILEHEGRIAGWLRSGVDGDAARFDVMADPGHPETLDIVVDAALARVAAQASAFSLVPVFALGLRDRLLAADFEERGEFVVLARRTVRPVRVPQLAPVAPVQVIPA